MVSRSGRAGSANSVSRVVMEDDVGGDGVREDRATPSTSPKQFLRGSTREMESVNKRTNSGKRPQRRRWNAGGCTDHGELYGLDGV